MILTYRELSSLKTFEERFRYLKLQGSVGKDTFGFDRFLNQDFYKSKEWKRLRDFVIARDNGWDLGVEGYGIPGKILVHHMNPITSNDIIHSTDFLLDPDFLITTQLKTHNAIHYGDESILRPLYVERSKNDTCPWRH